MSSQKREPMDWVKILTPKPMRQPEKPQSLFTASFQRAYELRDDFLEKKALPHVAPLTNAEIAYLKKRLFGDSEETLYEFGKRCIKEIFAPALPLSDRDTALSQLEPVLMRALYKIGERGDLEARHAETWIDGYNLTQLWGISEDILRGTVLAELPVYKMVMPGETFELIDGVGPKGARDYGTLEPDPSASSNNWWFDLDHVEFYEILHPEVSDNVTDYNSVWITPTLLAFVWGVELTKLLDWSRKSGLRPCVLSRRHGLLQAPARHLCIYGFHGCLFKAEDLRRFIKKYPDLRGLKELKKRDLDKWDVRNYATEHWKIAPTKSKRSMAEEIRDMVRSREAKYALSTIEEWIKDLNPRREKNKEKHNPKKRGKALTKIR